MDKDQKWFSLEITAQPEAAEAIEHALNELDALGTEINHLRRKADDHVTVIGYFHELPDDDRLRDEMHHALRIFDLDENSVHQISRGEVADQDWLHEWKKHWRPTTIGKFVIAPPWEMVEDESKIVITIEPNMAFGTGTHETTQLCLRAIEENYTPEQSFLDVGTGTGILAIAAAKAGTAGASPAKTQNKFLAVDTDVDSIAIARENAAANSVADRIDFRIGPLEQNDSAADFVCANLTIDAILPILDLLLSKTKRTLVLSGILQEQEGMITTALGNSDIKDFAIEQKGEWISVAVHI